MKPINFPPTQADYYPMRGGLDLVSPAISLDPGRCFFAQNYEPGAVGGYRRINGYERFDGQTSPTSATYWTIQATITGTVTTGATLTGATSAATGKVLGTSGTTIILGRVSGTYVSGEALQITAVTVATSTSVATASGATTASDHADFNLLAANDRRADILVVPGSGQIRGGFVLNDICYVFRDNAGGTAGAMYKQTSSGWSAVSLGREIQFVARSGTFTVTIAAPGVVTWNAHGFANGQAVTLSTTGALPTGLLPATTYYVINRAANTFQLSATSGGSAITTSGTQSGTHTVTLASGVGFAVGDTVTGASSGATAVVKAYLLRTGTAAVAPVGTLVFASVTGAFSSGEGLQVSSNVQAQSSTADTAITRAAAGRVEVVIGNFSGSTTTKKAYGADGVNLAFEFDGTTYVPIRTGMTTDTPVHVAVHKGHLFLSFVGSLQYSGVNSPYSWTLLTGANEIGMGDTITALVPQSGSAAGSGALAVTTNGKTSILYGSGSIDFDLVPSVDDIGYWPYTVQSVGNNTYGLTARGVQSLVTTLNYGDFQYASLSFLVQPLLATKVGMQCASVTLKQKNQYRLFFTDNTALVFGLTGEKISGILTLDYTIPVRCVWNATLSTGVEVTFFGSDDGYVYKDNIGTSFDGDAIEAAIRPVFNNLQSPRVRKQFRRGVFEVTCDGYCEVNITYDLGYANQDVSPAAVQEDQALTGAGGYWDQFTWDAFTWDSPVVAGAEISIDGTETNIGFLFYSSRAQDDPHTLQGASLLYTPRRLTR